MQMSLSVVTGTVTFLFALPTAKIGTCLFPARYFWIYALKIEPTDAPFGEIFVYFAHCYCSQQAYLKGTGSVQYISPGFKSYLHDLLIWVSRGKLQNLSTPRFPCLCKRLRLPMAWGVILIVYAERLIHDRCSGSDGRSLLSRVAWQGQNPKTLRFDFLVLQMNMKKLERLSDLTR